MRIEVVSDTICPWCYIGKRRLERALAMRSQEPFEVSWRPFQLNPTMPAGGIDHDKYLVAKFGSAERAGRQYERISSAGREEGIAFRFDLIRRTPNTVNSHRLLRFAARSGVQNTLAELLFEAYFLHGRDIGLDSELVDLARIAGLDAKAARAFLASDRDRAEVLAEDDRVRMTGVNGVPCFIIEDQYAVSGAQSPEIFLQIFDVVREERHAVRTSAVAE